MLDLPGFSRPADLEEVIAAASLLGGGVAVGLLVRILVTGRLKRRSVPTAWGGNDIVIHAVHHVALVWPAVAGAFAAIAVLPLEPAFANGLRRTLATILILSATFVAARLAADVIRLFARRTDQSMRSSSIFVNLARIVIGLLGFLILLQSFGVSITPLLTALGVGGLAVALALQDTLSNFFAGLQIIATKKVKPGDFVRLETGEEGYINDIDWRHTSIRQLPSNMVLVPNAKLINSVITNYHYPDPEMSVLIDVGVSYGSDLQHVERVTVDVAQDVLRENAGGVTTVDPFVRFHTFNDSSIDFTVILRVREFTEQYLVKHEFVKRLYRRFEAEGIVIPFPNRTLHFPEDASQDPPQRI